jgi:predicted metallopeptidase
MSLASDATLAQAVDCYAWGKSLSHETRVRVVAHVVAHDTRKEIAAELRAHAALPSVAEDAVYAQGIIAAADWIEHNTHV